MTPYRVELRQVDRQDRGRIQGAIALLSQVPRPPAARALQGRPVMRVRFGGYRIIYTVEDDILLIVVVTLGHRKDIYRGKTR
jgi:mRNA interferase RelE/StbE